MMQTGLLMSVIRSLTASRDMIERDREKANVQKQFQESDERLEKLVQQHHNELSSVMSAFSKVSSRLDAAKSRLEGIREKLLHCQSLLNCKRDELKRLWVESIETRHVTELLNLVEEQSKKPEIIAKHISKKHYLHATRELISSLEILEGRLKKVDALADVKGELIAKKDELFTLFMDDLHKHVYVRSTVDVIKKIKKQSEGEKRNILDSKGVSVADILSNPALRSSIASKTTSTSSPQSDDNQNEVDEDLNDDDPEADSKKFLTIIIKCLHLLNKIPEAVTVIKDREDKELSNIVRRTGRELLDSHASSSTKGKMINVQGNSIPDHLLQEYIDGLLTQFRCVADIHETIILPNLRQVTKETSPDAFYSMSEIWSKIQSLVEVVADQYSELSKNKNEDQANSAENDISIYFTRKRTDMVPSESKHMFRFVLSQPAIIFNEYLEEQQN